MSEDPEIILDSNDWSWTFPEVDQVNSENWIPVVEQQLAQELAAITSARDTIYNVISDAAPRREIKVKCTRRNPFDTSDNPICE